MNKAIRRVWTFTSDSNPAVEYQTLQCADGSTSCNCMGWTRRIASDGSRSCKHTRWVDLGMADRHCTGSKDYTKAQPSTKHERTKIQFTTPRLGHRKFAV